MFVFISARHSHGEADEGSGCSYLERATVAAIVVREGSRGEIRKEKGEKKWDYDGSKKAHFCCSKERELRL